MNRGRGGSPAGLLAALAAAAVLLGYRLDDVAGLHRDEAAFGLAAEAILRGELRPLAGLLSTYAAPLHSYGIALFFRLFGESLWSLRAGGVLANLLAAALYADLARRFLAGRAAWAAWFLVTMPSFVVLGRIAGENYALNPLLFMGGVWLFAVPGLRGTGRAQAAGLLAGGLCLGLAVWNHIVSLPSVLAAAAAYAVFVRPGRPFLVRSAALLLPGALLAAAAAAAALVSAPALNSGASMLSNLSPAVLPSLLNMLHTLGGGALYARACGEAALPLTFILPVALAAGLIAPWRRSVPEGERGLGKGLSAFVAASFLGTCLITPAGMTGSRLWIIPLLAVPAVLALALPRRSLTAAFLGGGLVAVNLAGLGWDYFHNFLEDGGVPRRAVFVGGGFDNSWDFMDLRPLAATAVKRPGTPVFVEDFNLWRLRFLLPPDQRERARLLTPEVLDRGAAPAGSLFAFLNLEDRLLPPLIRTRRLNLVRRPELSSRQFSVYEETGP
ncbi:MAG: glycosyltransferase family 39 protein [Elusimicrobia bacterium]|nr:glycosyltransferase family 39 protein [Elusimicrobiota bacterium]